MNPVDLVEFASDPAFCVDSEMRVTGWNDGVAELLGYTSVEAIGQKCSKILQAVYRTGEPLCSPLCEGMQCVTSGRKWGLGACQLRHKCGAAVNAGISSLVLPQEAGELNEPNSIAIFFLREITVAKREEAQAFPLRIFTLGQFGLAASEQGLHVAGWKRKQAALVLKCLLSNLDKPVHRETLIEWLWPNLDPRIGWQRLKVNISSLRSELRKGGVNSDIIETVGQSYLLRSSAVWVDADEFVKLVAAGWKLLKADNQSDALSRFEEAETLYRGDFFEDEPFAEWCVVERERLREGHLDMLAGLAACYADTGRYTEAARVCQKALSTDPCRENFVRTLMESLVKLNRPDWARAHFISWHRTLDNDYDLQPTEQTLEAYAELIGTNYSEAC